MAQIKIYGLREHLGPIKSDLSEAIHDCMMEALSIPREKRFHRFFPLERENFQYPSDRSTRYTIIEISMFEGRSEEAKKSLIRKLFQSMNDKFSISPEDIEITIFETPRQNWGVRGVPGDELGLSYKVEV